MWKGDTNHKSEIAVGLGKFEVFVGWQPLPEIQYLLTSIPALEPRFVQGQTHFNVETLKQIVRKILSLSDEEITSVYHYLQTTPLTAFGTHTYIPDLLPRLSQQYGKVDPGNLVALLMMNYLVLEKGDAIYVPADGIHAYLSGDIVECMARSDKCASHRFLSKSRSRFD
jgi:mannose-6-phosphate isomerase